MSRKRSHEPASSRGRQPQSQQKPAPRAAGNEAHQAAPPDFPFARNPEEDELRDMSGYGWGV